MARFKNTDWPERLWIVRHGESAGNVARDKAELGGLELIDISTRDADTPLSSLGHEQARALAHWFADMPAEQRPNALLTSPFVRAMQTATHMSDSLQLPSGHPYIDERLREKEFGILDRYTKHGILAKFPELAAQRLLVGKFYFRPPGGESWCDVILRLRSIVEVLRRDHVGERVLIVTHQVLVNCFRYLLESMDEARILAIDAGGDVPNCGVTEYALSAVGTDFSFALVRASYTLPLVDAGAAVTTSPDVPAGPR